jgi:hypothetical protein
MNILCIQNCVKLPVRECWGRRLTQNPLDGDRRRHAALRWSASTGLSAQARQNELGYEVFECCPLLNCEGFCFAEEFIWKINLRSHKRTKA